MAEQKRNPHELQAHAVGTLTSWELKEIKPKDTSKPAFNIIRAEISAGGSKLRTELWPSKRKPSLVNDTFPQFAEGQKVAARGSLEEQVGQDQRLYRSLRAWIIAPAEAHEEDRLVYHIAGQLGRLEMTAANEYVAPITCVRQYDKGGTPVDQESTLRVCPDKPLLEQLYKTVRPGQTVRARGDILNRMQFDRFGLPDPNTPMVSKLAVSLLEVWQEQQELWIPLNQVPAPAGGQQPPQQPAAQPVSQPQPGPATEPNFHDDDDVPF